MSNVSILEKKWIDLVFENKNQEYGAYQLRQENPKTTATAFIYAVVFLFCVSAIGMLFSSFGTKAIVEPDIFLSPPITLTDIVYPPKTDPIVIPKLNPITKIKDDISKKDLTNVIVVKKEDKPDEIKNNNDPKTNPNPVENGVVGGIIDDNPSTGKGQDVLKTIPVVIPNNTIESFANLDVMPEFPGGISKFYEYVGNNFEKPELESGTILTVYVSFVIEKDGKMTDIKVIRNPGFGMEVEAIRVLKSLKTNWKAGIKDGQKVRTLYTLPIKVKSE
jgi:periplasmic protein TonB